MTVAEILSRSSNVGTITLAELLGRSRLETWVERFGFGKRSGVDFPGETPGILPFYWSGSTIGTLPIGHGIAVTPVQMAAAYAAVANGGVWLRPRLVADRPAKRRRVMSRAVADQLLSMLRDVVIEGTGTEAEVEGYQVAGKTGTAAKPDPRGGYSKTLRRIVRRRRSGECAAARRARDGGRARERDLGRRRRGSGLPADRALCVAVPGDPPDALPPR